MSWNYKVKIFYKASDANLIVLTLTHPLSVCLYIILSTSREIFLNYINVPKAIKASACSISDHVLVDVLNVMTRKV